MQATPLTPARPPAATPTPLPPDLSRGLAEFEGRRRTLAFGQGLAETVALLGLGALFLALVEWAVHARPGTRFAGSAGVYLVALGVLAWRGAIPLLRRRSARVIARAFEDAAAGRFQERILSAVEMNSEPAAGTSRWMIDQTINLAACEMAGANPGELADASPARRAGQRAALVLLACLAVLLLPGTRGHLLLALNPFASSAVLPGIRLAILPGDAKVREGTPLTITVEASGRLEPARVSLVWNDGFRETVAMSETGTNRAELKVPALSQGFRYSVTAGEAESSRYEIKVDAPPHLGRLSLVIEPPAYARLTNQIVEGGSAVFTTGSRVRVRLEAGTGNLTQAQWLPEGGTARDFHADAGAWILDLQPTNPVAFQLRLTGANGLSAEPPQKWTLQPVPDAPPSARLVAIGADAGLVGRDEVLRLAAAADDDLGLQRVELVVLDRENLADHKTLFPTPGPPPGAPPRREMAAIFDYSLANLGTATGDDLQFELVATDLLGQTTRSEPVSVSLGTLEKTAEARLAAKIKRLISRVDSQRDHLAQTRASWLAIGRNYREDDAGSQAPALVLLRSRLNEWGAEIEEDGGDLTRESETNRVAEARFLYRLGSSLSVWGRQQREVLLEKAGHLGPGGGAARETFTQGRDLFGRAMTDLDQFHRVLTVLDGALETDVSAARCESALGRYQRGIPVLAPADGKPSPALDGTTGLLATFYEGTDLRGRVLEARIDLPRIDDTQPGGHHDQWSCRYEGDLRVPEAGTWTLACLVDDGVRLVVGGKSLLPADAWGLHSATEFQGTATLTNEWTPLTIEFFQASSQSKLRFLAARKGQPLQEVPSTWLRPPSARSPKPGPNPDPSLQEWVRAGVRDRVRASLAVPATVPPLVSLYTNVVRTPNLGKKVREQAPAAESLTTSLTNFAAWNPADLERAAGQAGGLTALAKEAQRVLHEELENWRWRFEGAAALKPLQNALQELREINQELAELPWNPSSRRTEQEQAKIDTAKAWEAELERATAEVAREFFETAKQKDATVSERAMALQAAALTETKLAPAEANLVEALEVEASKNELSGKMDARLNEIENQFRALNDLQERINREEVATEARQALPAARAFARAQAAGDTGKLPEKHDELSRAVARVEQAERVIGDYQEAARLAELTGETPEQARGRETAQTLRDIASRADNNPASLAKSIPPPMEAQTEALEKQTTTPQAAAQQLAAPRLAMAIEAARLQRNGDPKAAAAYELLGEDTGALLETPAKLDAPALRPLTERAEALAGAKGEEARQAEIRSAMERLQRLASEHPNDPAALAGRLDALAELARKAAGDTPKRKPLGDQLEETSTLATPVADWAESTQPAEIAASAAKDALEGIEAAPKAGESYTEAGQILSDAARQLRLEAASDQVANLDPFPATPADDPSDEAARLAALAAERTKMDGPAGKAITLPPPKGIDQAEWARLNDQLRRGIRSTGIEKFSEEQQVAIRAYFEKLSSSSGPPKR